MPNIIQDTTQRLWTTGRKTKTSNGWHTGNAPCCIHNGETADKRSRGHIQFGANGEISYGCFNCKFKAHYEPGQQLSYSFRKLLKWMGADESEVHRLVFEAMREKEQLIQIGAIRKEIPKEEIKVTFKKHELPEGASSIYGLVAFYELQDEKDRRYPKDLCDVVAYAAKRKLNFQKYDFYWTPNTASRMSHRLIVPFKWKDEVIGYTSRAIDDSIKPKYLTEIDSGYVFNMDLQTEDKQFVIVMEGPMDAMAVDGVAVLHGEVNRQQIALLESLNKEIIVVPDFEKSGSDLVRIAMDQGWSVSFPVWAEKVKDASAAVAKYGKLFVLKDIVDNVERRRLKIELLWRKYGR